MSSAAMKGIVIRPTPDLYKQRLSEDLDGSHRLDVFKVKKRSFLGVMKPSFGSVGVITSRHMMQECYYGCCLFHGNGKNMWSSRQRRLDTRAEAILSPFSDPTPTMKKVYLFYFFFSDQSPYKFISA